MMTHFAVTSQQFRINFIPTEVIETKLSIRQMTMPLLYTSFRLSLIFIWQMFSCLDDENKSGISCRDVSSQSVTS